MTLLIFFNNNVAVSYVEHPISMGDLRNSGGVFYRDDARFVVDLTGNRYWWYHNEGKNQFYLTHAVGNESLIDIIYQSALLNKEIDFDKIITDFSWERLLVIPPLARRHPTLIMRDMGLETEPQSISTTINFNSNVVLFIFIDANRVVSYVEYPRYLGDFFSIFSDDPYLMYENGVIFNRYDTKFAFVYEETYDFSRLVHALR
jgi:hypothetical protein